jgi:hypothetical protein
MQRVKPYPGKQQQMREDASDPESAASQKREHRKETESEIQNRASQKECVQQSHVWLPDPGSGRSHTPSEEKSEAKAQKKYK